EPDDAANLRIAIAQVEIPVAVALPLEVADLAPTPQIPEACLDHLSRLEREIAHRQRVVRSGANRTRAAAARNIGESKRQRLLHRRCEASSAARTVFAISIAMVIGPTPPGTGVIFDATSRTESKAT